MLTHRIQTEPGVEIAITEAGSGPPLLLLHGYPQSHHCWLPALAHLTPHFRCILPDLRGYGASSTPQDDKEHTTYSKRRMALDLVVILDQLGVDRTHIAGHDRGARVAYRFALDHPERLDKLAILDVIPTIDFWNAWTANLAMKAYHWTFLAQPASLPEKMIAADPFGYVEHTLRSWTAPKTLEPFAPQALAAYRAQMANPANASAMCADYRAGYHTDRVIDAEDKAAGRWIEAPTLFLWGAHGFPASTGDPLGVWKSWAPDLTGQELPSGHFAPEEVPRAVATALINHFETPAA